MSVKIYICNDCVGKLSNSLKKEFEYKFYLGNGECDFCKKKGAVAVYNKLNFRQTMETKEWKQY